MIKITIEKEVTKVETTSIRMALEEAGFGSHIKTESDFTQWLESTGQIGSITVDGVVVARVTA